MQDAAMEKKLIQKAARGDQRAFEQLLKACSSRSYALAVKMLKHPQNAEDAVQDAFIKAWRSLPGFQGDCRFDSWMYRIVYNTCLDYLRRDSRHPILSLTEHENSEEEGQLDVPDSAPGPEEQLMQKEGVSLLMEEMHALSDKLREPLLLRELQGKSYEEIAEELELPVGTVRSRISRARQTLAERIREKGTFPNASRQRDRKEGDRNDGV